MKKRKQQSDGKWSGSLKAPWKSYITLERKHKKIVGLD